MAPPRSELEELELLDELDDLLLELEDERELDELERELEDELPELEDDELLRLDEELEGEFDDDALGSASGPATSVAQPASIPTPASAMLPDRILRNSRRSARAVVSSGGNG